MHPRLILKSPQPNVLEYLWSLICPVAHAEGLCQVEEKFDQSDDTGEYTLEVQFGSRQSKKLKNMAKFCQSFPFCATKGYDGERNVLVFDCFSPQVKPEMLVRIEPIHQRTKVVDQEKLDRVWKTIQS